MNGKIVNAFLGLGTNLGDRKENLDKALGLISCHEGINIKRISSIYETKPVGYIDQSDFLNLVVMVETNLNPFELLDTCLKIELDLKRERTIRWGPRTIDIDVLIYENKILKSDKLEIPHPRMHEREFVLAPLNEIAPDAVHPTLGKTVQEMLLEVGNQDVKK